MKDIEVDYSDQYRTGRKLIESAIKLDESLAELLKVEVSKMKKLNRYNESVDEIARANTLLKNVIMAMMITDEKIRNGINLCKNFEKKE